MFSKELLERFRGISTPFYYYDLELLRQTLQMVKQESGKYNFIVHYALKANANNKVLETIKSYGMGADCVSGNEVRKAIECGFLPEHIVFAGVGKTDEEIIYALDQDIACFNCESIQEIEVINELAGRKSKIAEIALRINPNVAGNTHKYITTGLEENKFGINISDLNEVINCLNLSKNIKLVGLHFHIGSQITDLNAFRLLCNRVNEIQDWFFRHRINIQTINVGGGLGVDYHEPEKNGIADFESYFKLFYDFLELRPGQKVHFELGRAIVAQAGSLVSKVLYTKKGVNTNFIILDAGMTELMRPALYQAYHKIENLSKKYQEVGNQTYDVVGPVCESSDYFGKAVDLPETGRGDIVIIMTAGAYGEVMSSTYNLREKAKAVYSE